MLKNVCTPILKNVTALLLITAFVVALSGCPYSSAYKLDSQPTVPVEDVYLGKWATFVSDASGKYVPVKMIMDKKNDYEYNICFTGNLEALKRFRVVVDDSIKATAFVSEAASRRFLNIYLYSQYYIAEFIYKNDKITLLPLCEHFTSKLIKSDAEMRPLLELHYKSRLYPLYDDEFCLREMSRVN